MRFPRIRLPDGAVVKLVRDERHGRVDVRFVTGRRRGTTVSRSIGWWRRVCGEEARA